MMKFTPYLSSQKTKEKADFVKENISVRGI